MRGEAWLAGGEVTPVVRPASEDSPILWARKRPAGARPQVIMNDSPRRPRCAVSVLAYVVRETDGPITVEIHRGDGCEPEAYRSIASWTLLAAAGEPVEIKRGVRDVLPPGDARPRHYALRVTSDVGISVSRGQVIHERGTMEDK